MYTLQLNLPIFVNSFAVILGQHFLTIFSQIICHFPPLVLYFCIPPVNESRCQATMNSWQNLPLLCLSSSFVFCSVFILRAYMYAKCRNRSLITHQPSLISRTWDNRADAVKLLSLKAPMSTSTKSEAKFTLQSSLLWSGMEIQNAGYCTWWTEALRRKPHFGALLRSSHFRAHSLFEKLHTWRHPQARHDQQILATVQL